MDLGRLSLEVRRAAVAWADEEGEGKEEEEGAGDEEVAEEEAAVEEAAMVWAAAAAAAAAGAAAAEEEEEEGEEGAAEEVAGVACSPVHRRLTASASSHAPNSLGSRSDNAMSVGAPSATTEWIIRRRARALSV